VRVAVAEPAAGKLDVRLLRGDVAQARAAAHDVDEYPWHLGADHVGDPLQHQAEAGRRGEGHGAQAGAAAAVDVVDRRDLRNGLEEDAMELGQELGHQLRALGGRRDRIAVDVPAAGEQGADGRGVGPLDHQGLDVGQGLDGVRDVVRRRRLAVPVAEELGGVLELPLLGLGQQPIGLRAGGDAEAAAVADLEVEDDGNQAGGRVDLGAQRDAVLGAGLDTSAASLAVLREHEGLRPFADLGMTHGRFPLWERLRYAVHSRGRAREAATRQAAGRKARKGVRWGYPAGWGWEWLRYSPLRS